MWVFNFFRFLVYVMLFVFIFSFFFGYFLRVCSLYFWIFKIRLRREIEKESFLLRFDLFCKGNKVKGNRYVFVVV